MAYTFCTIVSGRAVEAVMSEVALINLTLNHTWCSYVNDRATKVGCPSSRKFSISIADTDRRCPHFRVDNNNYYSQCAHKYPHTYQGHPEFPTATLLS